MISNKQIATLAATAAGFVGNHLATKIWKKGIGEEIPYNVRDPEINWKRAFGWALFSSGLVTGLQLFFNRAAQKAQLQWQENIDKTRKELTDSH